MTNLWINLNQLICITGVPKEKQTESGTKNCEEIIGETYKLRDNMKLRKLQVGYKDSYIQGHYQKLLKSKDKEEILIAIRGKK